MGKTLIDTNYLAPKTNQSITSAHGRSWMDQYFYTQGEKPSAKEAANNYIYRRGDDQLPYVLVYNHKSGKVLEVPYHTQLSNDYSMIKNPTEFKTKYDAAEGDFLTSDETYLKYGTDTVPGQTDSVKVTDPTTGQDVIVRNDTITDPATGDTSFVTDPNPTTYTPDGNINTDAGNVGSGNIPRIDTPEGLQAYQQGQTDKIYDIETDTAKKNYDTNVAAIDAASTELLGGIDTAQEKIDTQSKEYKEYIEFGKNALTSLVDEDEDLFRDFTLDDFQTTPAYDLRKREGQNAIINRGSALGVTGQTAKDFIKYSQDYAYDAFGTERSYFTGQQDKRLNYLTSAANMGLGALSDQSRLTGISADLDLNRSNIKANKFNLTADATTARDSAIGQAGVDKEKTYANIGTNYFSSKNESEFNKRLFDSNKNANVLNNILSGGALAFKLSGGNPWVTLAGGAAGGLATNYFS